ncbi:phage major tail tube protein [Pseudomonas sp. SAR267]|uniref:phage major tail tube protein n=1 Tax=Pseudomonas TaxID=286 RepID=UPI00071B3DBE|nr:MULTISPECIES: phage major tail tube protein [Pseudomonas]KSO44939.1 phage major tail tube protein [Pseudomonas aeruginosa]MBI7751433.1 phage major tail tube protein [Pseudomonas aeruginosa]RFQ06419.1 phage major tail tube protein [Pseudomonas putida]
MAGFTAHRITNAALYLDGNSFFGRCEEVDLGSVKTVTSDFQGLGMVGLIELPDGIDKLEGKIVWNSLYYDAAKRLATPFKTVQLQLRSNVQVFNNTGLVDELPLVSLLTVTFKEYQLGSFKPRDPSKFESPFSATYVRQVLDGQEIVLLDYLANIFKVGGEDQLAKYRKNIGQ